MNHKAIVRELDSRILAAVRRGASGPFVQFSWPEFAELCRDEEVYKHRVPGELGKVALANGIILAYGDNIVFASYDRNFAPA